MPRLVTSRHTAALVAYRVGPEDPARAVRGGGTAYGGLATDDDGLADAEVAEGVGCGGLGARRSSESQRTSEVSH
jgi:hypothetical protein